MKHDKFTFIDLFAGIGGFRLALEQAGGRCLGFSEIAPDAISAYCDIFENVKGLADPRNKEALAYIMDTIKDAGFHAQCHLLNAFDYGVPQNRIRIYIIGFKEELHAQRFSLPEKRKSSSPVSDAYPFAAA